MGTREEAVEAALDFVHADVERLVRQVASEHAIVNMGQEVEDWIPSASTMPERFFESAFRNFLQQSESDEMAEGIEEERRCWYAQARKDVAKIEKKRLPPTVRNVRSAFLREGLFARRVRS